MKLETLFTETLFRLTGNESAGVKLWPEIEHNHSQKSRYYHNLFHLEQLAIVLSEIKEEIRDWDILVLAIAYHDIVYHTRKSNNEEKSADYAGKALSGLISKENNNLLSQFIMATKAHNKSENEDINYFTDADLSILGATPDEYDKYTTKIRNEYKLCPLFIYKPGRAKVIRHFLDMDTLFKTGFFYARYEKKARENLQAELDRLSR